MEEPKFSNTSAMSLYIGGVNVKFPVKPYPSQLSMMSQIIRGLERKHHCLLESPTGSGKSLALLCSAIAWQQAQHAKYEDDVIAKLKSCSETTQDLKECTCQKAKIGSTSDQSKYFDKSATDKVIDLCSDDDDDDFKPTKKPNTRSQAEKQKLCVSCVCKQAKTDPEAGDLPEWKKPRVPKIWFGTRTHKQIGQITKELGRTQYSSTKMTILSSRNHSCIHPAVMKSSNKNEECKELRLRTHVSEMSCAYYHNLKRMKTHHQLNCAGMNGAWDLEDLIGLGKTVHACPFYSARELIASADVVFCPYNYLINPMIRKQMQINPNNQIIIMDEAHNIEDSARDAGSYSISEEALGNTTADLYYLICEQVKPDDHRPLHLLCQKLGEWIGEHTKNLKPSDYETSSDVWSGRSIIEHLKEWGITQDTLPLLEANLSSALDLGDEDQESAKVMHSSSQALLGGLFNVLRYLMNEEYKYCDDYRVTILKQAVFKVPPPKRTRDGWISLYKKSKKHLETTLNFWCLNPAVAISDLKQAHSIILTSGTLSPMSSFSSELGLSFPIQLEANHVIKDSQVWVGALGCGPRGIELEATYKNTDRFDFQDELGDLILQVCHVVPHGVLCFFSSYGMLNKMSARWKDTGLWHKLQERKHVVCEPRSSNKEEFEALLQTFYNAIADSQHNEAGGAIMFAVCRGKVSEGLDFADNNARAVITVGIPFPSIKDKQVELKRKYNDMHKAQRGLLSGGQWYEIQAYRAMNQALGRCIRHKNDWGALIIVDRRFCKNPKRYSKGLSKWVRMKMNTYPRYEHGKSNLAAFVQRWKELENSKSAISAAEPPSSVDLTATNMSSPPATSQHCRTPNKSATSTTRWFLGGKENQIPISPSPLQEGNKESDVIHASEEIEEAFSHEDFADDDFANDTIAATPQKDITIIPESPLSEVKAMFKSPDGILKQKVRQQLVFGDAVCNDEREISKNMLNKSKKMKQEDVKISNHTTEVSERDAEEDNFRESKNTKKSKKRKQEDEKATDRTLEVSEPDAEKKDNSHERKQKKKSKKRKHEDVKASDHTTEVSEPVAADENSLDMLPRRKRSIKKAEKESKNALWCVGCNEQLCQPGAEIESEETRFSFLNNWMAEKHSSAVNVSERRLFTIRVEDLQVTALRIFETDGLNSRWCETDALCYKLHRCFGCSRTVGFQVVSDAALKDRLLIPASLVTVNLCR